MGHRISRLVVVGSVIGEVRLFVPNHPETGGAVRANHSIVQAAGAFRPLVTARVLGLPATLVGRLGNCPISRLLTHALARSDVELTLPRTEGTQGYTIAVAEPDGVITVIENPGVETSLTRADLDAVRIEPSDLVLVLGYDLHADVAGRAIAGWVADGGVGDGTLVFAPGPLAADIHDDVLDAVIRRTNLLVLKAQEFSMLTGVTAERDRLEAAQDFQATLAPGSSMLVTQFPTGSWLILPGGEGRWLESATAQLSGISRYGALEAHLGVFLAEYARLGDVERAARNALVGWSLVPPPTTPWVTSIGPDRARLDQALAAQESGP